MKRRKPAWRRAIANWGEDAALRAMLGTLGAMPWPFIEALAGAAAWLHATLLPMRREVALRNLAIAFPAKSEAERGRIAREAARHTVLFAAEVAKLRRMPPEAIAAAVETDEKSLNDLRALDAGATGYLLATGHFGNWEWCGAWVRRALGRVAVVYKPLHNARVDARMRQIREAWGEKVISTRERPPRSLIAAIRGGGGIAILSDQDARRAGEFIPFFGRPASTATGLAELALRFNTSILIGVMFRTGPGRLRFRTLGRLDPDPAAPRAAEVERIMLAYHAALESAIREHPGQYFWWHNRWKTAPREKPAAQGPKA